MYKNTFDVSRENRFSLCHIPYSKHQQQQIFFVRNCAFSSFAPFFICAAGLFFLLSFFLGSEVKLRLKFYKSFSPLASAQKRLNCGCRMVKEEQEIHINVIPIWGFRLFRSLFFCYFIYFLEEKYFCYDFPPFFKGFSFFLWMLFCEIILLSVEMIFIPFSFSDC